MAELHRYANHGLTHPGTGHRMLGGFGWGGYAAHDGATPAGPVLAGYGAKASPSAFHAVGYGTVWHGGAPGGALTPPTPSQTAIAQTREQARFAAQLRAAEMERLPSASVTQAAVAATEQEGRKDISAEAKAIHQLVRAEDELVKEDQRGRRAGAARRRGAWAIEKHRELARAAAAAGNRDLALRHEAIANKLAVATNTLTTAAGIAQARTARLQRALAATKERLANARGRIANLEERIAALRRGGAAVAAEADRVGVPITEMRRITTPAPGPAPTDPALRVHPGYQPSSEVINAPAPGNIPEPIRAVWHKVDALKTQLFHLTRQRHEIMQEAGRIGATGSAVAAVQAKALVQKADGMNTLLATLRSRIQKLTPIPAGSAMRAYHGYGQDPVEKLAEPNDLAIVAEEEVIDGVDAAADATAAGDVAGAESAADSAAGAAAKAEQNQKAAGPLPADLLDAARAEGVWGGLLLAGVLAALGAFVIFSPNVRLKGTARRR